MQNKSFFFLFCIFFFLFTTTWNNYAKNLNDVYRLGQICLNEDLNYGRGVDWEELFHDTNKALTIGADGSIYITNARQHCIFIFNPEGTLVHKFGQKGVGPGDIYNPASPSILDGHYLVVGNHPQQYRINLFHLNGKHYKTLKTNQPASSQSALRNGKILYIRTQFFRKKKKRSSTFIIKDIHSNKESEVCTITSPYVYFQENGILTIVGSFKGTVYYTALPNGNFAVGVSNSPELKIYSSKGRFLYSFLLKIQPIPVTKAFISDYRERFLRSALRRSASNRYFAHKKKILSSIPYEDIFDSHLPYYKSFTSDTQGNILVFKETGDINKNQPEFQVYSPKGDYRGEVIVSPGIFKFSPKNVNMYTFTNKGLFGLFQLNDCDDVLLKLIRVNWQSSSPNKRGAPSRQKAL